MKSTFSYFKTSFAVSILAIAGTSALGWFEGGMNLLIAYAIATVMLGMTEFSVSLDNAAVNAKYIAKMNERSKHWFLTWGMVIAVFGMRFALPILIVAAAAGINPIAATVMAFTDPAAYQHHIESVELLIYGFGAGFLLMVALEFFFNGEKDHHWIPGIEHLAAFVGKFPHVQILIAIPMIVAAGAFAPAGINGQTLSLSGFGGMLLFYAIRGLKEILEAMEKEKEAQMVASGARLMLGSLIFLEVLDASFSFDGVVAAFAITNNFLVITAGLGLIGAMFVRSLTVYLVDKGTMSELKYIEHGAFWGIAWLVCAMIADAYGAHLGEAVVAGTAGALIALSVGHSIIANKRELKAA